MKKENINTIAKWFRLVYFKRPTDHTIKRILQTAGDINKLYDIVIQDEVVFDRPTTGELYNLNEIIRRIIIRKNIMGFFSWKTMDTNKSIANSYSTIETFPVTMTDDKGNKWTENNYEGYGVFGGKDFYELLAEMNNIKPKEGGTLRNEGISLALSGKPHVQPNLSEDPEWEWKEEHPKECEAQGYFY